MFGGSRWRAGNGSWSRSLNFFRFGVEVQVPVRLSIADARDLAEVSPVLVVLHQLEHGVLALTQDADVEGIVRHCVFGHEGDVVAAQHDRYVGEYGLQLLREPTRGLEAHRERANADDVWLEVHNALDHLGHVQAALPRRRWRTPCVRRPPAWTRCTAARAAPSCRKGTT